MPSAVARLSGGKIEISSACEPGIIGPGDGALQHAEEDQRLRLQAMPQRKDATVKSSTETTKVRTTP